MLPKKNSVIHILAKLRAVTDPAEIEYIIVNHTEPDHSGSLQTAS